MILNPHIHLTTKGSAIIGALSFLIVLSIWSLLSFSGFVSPTKLPSPAAVIQAFGYLGWSNGHSMLLEAAGASITRIAVAALIVAVIGIPVGVLMGASPLVNAFLSPLIDPFRSAPIVSLLPIFVMWLGIGEEMKISFLFVCAVVYLIPMVRDAMLSVQYSYWETAKDLGATDFECITKAILPIAAPRILDALIVSISILWTYITVAEYVNATSGLGQLIQNARRFSAMDQVFVGIFTIIALALLTYNSLVWLKKRIYFWEGKQ
jgi:ABC-type nitrate/sulfonate/bicarbonate transport system permease component